MALLGHATWLLVQVLLVAAAICWVSGCCGLSAYCWLRFLHRREPRPACLEQESLPALGKELLRIPWRSALLAWPLLVALAAVTLAFSKPRDKVGLSTELELVEHFLLIGLGGLLVSTLLCPLLLVILPAGRQALVRANPIGFEDGGMATCALRALLFSVAAHFIAGLAIPLVLHGASAVLVLSMVWLVLAMARCGSRKRFSDEASGRRRSSRMELAALVACTPLLALLKVAGLFAVFLFDCAFLDRYLLGAGGQAFVHVHVGGACGVQAGLLVASAVDAHDCAAYAEDEELLAFALGRNGSCYGYDLAVNDSDFRNFRRDGLGSACNEGNWTELPEHDFFVLQPRSGCPFAYSGGGRGRDLRRLAVNATNGSGSPDAGDSAGSTTLLPAAMERLCGFLGLLGAGAPLRSALELTLRSMRAVVLFEPYAPRALLLQCSAIPRLASACMVLGSVALLLMLGATDVLGILFAGKDIAVSRAARSGSRITFLSTIAVVQLLQHMVLLLLQVFITASAQMRFEVIGIFQKSCGYLVGETDLSLEVCPNPWHALVDVLAMALLFLGILISLALILTLMSGLPASLTGSTWVLRLALERHLGKARHVNILDGKEEEDVRCGVLSPLSGLAVSFGIWTPASAKTQRCSTRRRWLLARPTKAEVRADGSEEAPGANSDLVSWRAMSEASAWMTSFTWLPIPIVGGVMCKAVLYMNRHVVLACGKDGAVEDSSAQDPYVIPGASVADETSQDDSSLRKYLLQGVPFPMQVLNWFGNICLFAALIVVQLSAFFEPSRAARVDVLAVCLGVVLVLVLLRATVDIALQLRCYRAGCLLVQACEELLADALPALAAEGADPEELLIGLPGGERARVRGACQQLMQLEWIQQKRLAPAVESWLHSARGQLCMQARLFQKLADRHRRDNGAEVTPAVLLSAKVMLLRAAAHADLVFLQARRATRRAAVEAALKAADARSPSFQRWAANQAKTLAVSSANSLLEAAKARLRAKESGDEVADELSPLWLKLSFAASTDVLCCARPYSVPGNFEIVELQEARLGVSVWGHVTIAYPWDEDSEPVDMSVNCIVEEPPAGVMDGPVTPPLQVAPPEPPGSLEECPASLEWWERHFSLPSCSRNPMEAFSLQQDGPHFLAPDCHLKKVPPALPKQQEAALKSMLPNFGRLRAKDEDRLVHWTQGFEVHPWFLDQEDWMNAGVPLPARQNNELEDDADSQADAETEELIEKIKEAIRNSVVQPRTLMLAGAFLSAISAQGQRCSAAQAARQARLLGIASRLARNAGRRREARAQQAQISELDEIEEVDLLPDPDPLPASPVSFKTYRLPEPRASLEYVDDASVVEDLRTALSQDPLDMEELSKALERARKRKTDVDPILLQRAEECFMKLIAKQGAVTELVSAVSSRVLKALRAALQKASEVDLAESEYPDAQGVGIVQKARLVMREEEAAALAELRTCIQAGGALRLQRALDQADEAQVDHLDGGRAALREARERLHRIGQKKQGILLLKVAIATGNAGLLRAAIDECEAQGPSMGEVNLSLAKKRLATLERAASRFKGNVEEAHARQAGKSVPDEASVKTPHDAVRSVLQAALCHEPLDANLLRIAVKQALDAGLPAHDADIMKGQDLLESLMVKMQALEEMKRAGVERDARGLAAGIKRCQKLGIPTDQLVRALEQLTEEIAKVTRIAGDHGIGNLLLEDVETIRKELHDKMQAARGGARVVCRIRPALASEASRDSVVRWVDEHTLRLSTLKPECEWEEALGVSSELQLRTRAVSATSDFRFNGAVLDRRSSQEDVFEEVRGLVQSAVDGFNVLLAAAGAPHSGKSFTMFGPPFELTPGLAKRRDWSGLATRVVQELFEIKERDSWRADLEVDMQLIEIHGQRIVDLLSRNAQSAAPVLRQQGHLALRGSLVMGAADNSNDSPLDGALSRRVSSRREFLDVLQTSSVAAEELRNASTHSEHHVLVFLYLTRTNRVTGTSVKSKLVLADLAGLSASVTADESEAKREVDLAYQAIEAIIKSSRRNGQASATAASRRRHMVGQILRDCLVGTARPLFLVTLSPDEAQRLETLRAVTFASALGGRARR
eukprot:TRINITY_DN106894_c0_g1_i1.p1 TRINITY_DN106894_c0_g1~~TRINITY_DN106894_c0_g1_i1.p1  ORF type:complete len:2250 (+),score=455.76 TRINITY_DN106894_c0_g1_i1:492-6752(+)